MINIISQAALRRTASGPKKVVTNLMEGLRRIRYPFVLNQRLDACKRLWIHDDIAALCELGKLPAGISVLVGPNLAVTPQQLPNEVDLTRAVYIQPSHWAKAFWQELGFTSCPVAVWPVGIDTDTFVPIPASRTHVVVYCKQRPQHEIDTVLAVLRSRSCTYTVLRYPQYTEHAYQAALHTARYLIWLGCHESQGIALQEAMATGVPVLVCDVSGSTPWLYRHANMRTLTTEQISAYSKATSAEYFDETCGLKIASLDGLTDALDYIESHIQTYRPRDYVVNHLSLEMQAKAFVNLYERYFGLPYQAGMKETILHTGLWKGAGVGNHVKIVAKDVVRAAQRSIRSWFRF